ncbi:MAG: protein translocase subunit SecDF, partial [Clostridiales bacterium]|nr:protein translocase subunit SecDF [Clostridiales bacterium]
MNSKVKKVLSIIIVILVVFGAYVSVFGIGSVKNIKDELTYGLDINGGVYVVMQANTGTQSGTALTETMDRTKEVLNRRVDSMGVSNANVSVEGNNRLRIEMPGVKDAKTAIDR